VRVPDFVEQSATGHAHFYSSLSIIVRRSFAAQIPTCAILNVSQPLSRVILSEAKDLWIRPRHRTIAWSPAAEPARRLDELQIVYRIALPLITAQYAFFLESQASIAVSVMI